jgi:hypothetical protein
MTTKDVIVRLEYGPRYSIATGDKQSRQRGLNISFCLCPAATSFTSVFYSVYFP